MQLCKTSGAWAAGMKQSFKALQAHGQQALRLSGFKHCFTIPQRRGQQALRLQALLHNSIVGWPAMLAAGHMHKLHAHTDRWCEPHTRPHCSGNRIGSHLEAVKTGPEAIGPEKVLTCPRPQAARLRQTTDRAPRRWLLQLARCRPGWSLDPSAVACDACLGPPSRSLCPTLPSFCPPLQHR